MPDHHQPISQIAFPPVLAVQDENATVVVAETPWGLQATGSSKREPGDQKNYARGYRLALARALINLGYEIQRVERRQIRRETLEAQQETLKKIHAIVDGMAQRSGEAAMREEQRKRFANTPQAKRIRTIRAERRTRQ